MLPLWLLRAWVAAVCGIGILFSLAAMQSLYSSGTSAGLFGAEAMALTFNGLLGVVVIYPLTSMEHRIRALEERQRAADTRLIPASVQTDPPSLPPSTDIQSNRPGPRD